MGASSAQPGPGRLARHGSAERDGLEAEVDAHEGAVYQQVGLAALEVAVLVDLVVAHAGVPELLGAVAALQRDAGREGVLEGQRSLEGIDAVAVIALDLGRTVVGRAVLARAEQHGTRSL